MTTQYIYNMVDTWNDGATTFTSIKMGVTDSASNAASLLMDLQVGGVSQAYIQKSGTSFFGAIRTSPIYGYSDTASARLDTTANRNLAFTGVSLQLRTGGHFGFTSGDAAGTADLFLTRRTTANLRLGAADTTATTAPTPQFLSAQSWASSTTNDQLGANFTIDGSQGTGTGAGGSIIFRVAPAGGTSNGVQNGLSAALTIASDRTTTFAANVYFTNTSAGFTFSNSATFSAVANGTTLANFDGGGSQCVNFGSTGIGFGATTGYNSADVRLLRDATNTLALRNSTAAQRFNVYNTWTTSTNYEAFKIDWITTANTVLVGTEKGSVGGTARDLEFQRDGTTQIVLANGETRIGAGASPLITFGQSSASTSARFGFYGGAQLVNSTVSGAVSLRLTNGSLNDFGLLQFGGTSASFPAIKRNGAGIDVVGADGTNVSFVRVPGVAVASLPAAATAGAGARSFVTDANATTYASTVAGGGANKVPVFSDGTNWLIG